MPLSPVTQRSARELAGGSSALPDPRARPRKPPAREDRQAVGGEEGRRGPLLARLGAWLLVGLLRLGWRWRRQLAAPGAILGLALVVAIGHAASEGLAWVPLVLGAGLAGAILLLGHRPIHRWYAGGAGAGGAWAAAAWWVGLADPVVLGSLALLGVAAATVWIRHHSSRGRVRVVGGSAWPWRWGRWQFARSARREIKRAIASWAIASYWGKVPRSEICSAIADIDEDHYLLTAKLVPGHLRVDLTSPRAASAIGAPGTRVSLVQDDHDSERPANVVLIQWFHAGLAAAADHEEEGGRAEERPEPEDQQAFRLERLRWVAGELGAEVISARKLATRAGIPHDWVRRWLPGLARELGMKRVSGGWQRLGVEEEKAS
jgi:hypothetical protein